MPKFTITSYEGISYVESDSPREAVEAWARAYDRESADYTIIEGQPAEVEVTDSGGRAMTFIVRGEVLHEYTAEYVDDGDWRPDA